MNTKTLKKSHFLMVLLLVAIPVHVQATEGCALSKDKKIEIGHKKTLSQSGRRPHELLIPANGHCLYTSIILGYLLPVMGNPNDFNKRLGLLTNKKALPITHDQLASHYNDLHYLHSDKAFQQVIGGFLKQINTQSGTWGGPKEIQLIAEKFNLNIQEYTPDPDHPKQLIKSNLIQPETWITPPETTLHIVQDTPLKEELVSSDNDPDLENGQLSSLQNAQHRHHYRPYYKDDFPQPPKVTHTKPRLSLTQHDNPPKYQHDPSLPGLLQAHYARQNTLPGLLGDTSQFLENHYIHPAIVREAAYQLNRARLLNKEPDFDITKKDGEGHEEECKDYSDEASDSDTEKEQPFHKKLDYGLLKSPENLIMLGGLWKIQASQSQAPKHVVITGEAGMGKSTLAHYIAYQWAKGNLWSKRFTWMLHIPLGKIRHPHPNTSVAEQVANLLDIPGLVGDSLQGLLMQDQPGLLILDGHDEVATEVKKENSPLAQWLQQCFQQHPHLSIILTTRPGTHCPYPQHPRYLRVLGFLTQDIDRYIKAYFPPEVPKKNALTPSKSQKAKSLLQVLQKNPSIKLLSHIPLYLRLLCILTKQQNPNTLERCSSSQLYQQIIGRFLCYHLAHQNHKGKLNRDEKANIFKTYEWELTYLGELAFEGMEKNQTVLPMEVQKQLLERLKKDHPRKNRTEPEYWNRIASLGLLQGYSSSSPAPNEDTYFPNLTIQEWLAARHLVMALHDRQNRDHKAAKYIINQDKYNPRYQAMIPFIAGRCYWHVLGKNDPQGKGLMAFWQLLETQPREPTSIYHTLLVARCLEACRADTSSNLPHKLQVCHKNLVMQVAAWLQALLNYPINLQNVNYWTTVLLPRTDPLTAELQSCHRLLQHPLITHSVKPLWSPLSLGGGEWDTITQHWYARLAKIKVLAALPLGHPTATHLAIGLEQALHHTCEGVREAAIKTLSLLLPALLSNNREKTFLKPIHAALIDNDWGVRYAAVKTLPELLPGLQPQEIATFLKPIQKALDDGEYWIRETALKVLPSLLPVLKPQEVFKILKKASDDSNEYVRQVVLRVLPRLQPALKPQDILKILKKAFDDINEDIRASALEALSKLLPVLPSQKALNLLKKALEDYNEYVQEVALEALPSILQAIEPQEVFKWCKKALGNNDSWKVRYAVLDALPSLLSALKPREAFKWCQKALGDKEWDIRETALEALPSILPSLQPQQITAFLKPIYKALTDNHKSVRYAAAQVLPSFLPVLKPQEALKWLQQALADNSEYVRQVALDKLPSLLQALEHQEAFKWCQKAFDDHDWDVRLAALEALPSILPLLKPQEAFNLLKKALEDNNEYVRDVALVAVPSLLRSLQPQEGFRWCKKVLEENDSWRVRYIALNALPSILQAIAPQEAFKWCQKAFDENEWDIREVALEALPALLQTLEPQKAFSWCKKAFNDNDWEVRIAAVRSLPKLMTALKDQEVLTLFKKAFDDYDWDVRIAAIQELPNMLPALKAQEVFSLLKKTLTDDNSNIRTVIIQALPQLLSALKPQEVFSLLKKTLVDDNQDVRKVAIKALPEFLSVLTPQEVFGLLKKTLGDDNQDVRTVALRRQAQ